jgi:hypothetical protein
VLTSLDRPAADGPDASERVREYFIAAAFRKPHKSYDKKADYKGTKRSLYTTPFLEAKETLPKSPPALANALCKAYPLADEIRKLRDTRNKLIHELATAIGSQERRFIDQRPTLNQRDYFNFETLQNFRRESESLNQQRLAETTKQLTDWYVLLVPTPQDFILRRCLRLCDCTDGDHPTQEH